MSKVDVRPSSQGRLVDFILNHHTTSWRDYLDATVSPDSRIRIFTDPLRRAGQVKKFYFTFRGAYPSLSVEAVDYAMEMYLLGWIDSFQVCQVARNYDLARMAEEELLLVWLSVVIKYPSL